MGQPEAFRELVAGRQDIRHVDRPTLDQGATADGTRSQRERKLADVVGRNRSVMRDQSKSIITVSKNKNILGLAQTHGALRHRVEHGLDVCRRTGDDT